MQASADRNLLFGILALQMDFISREQLIAGMQDWVLEKSIPLADHLIRKGALQPEDRGMLEPLVAKHVQKHDDDPARSLAALSSVAPIQRALNQLEDGELHATLNRLGTDARSPQAASASVDPLATLDFNLGANTSQGTRFRILRPHAEGGLGSVYVANDTEFDREVALKEIQFDKSHDADNRTRFTREAEITGGLEHPGIVPVYGLGTYPDGRPFYAMRFIRGSSLKEAIERFHRPEQKSGAHGERNLRLRKLLQRFIDVCEAIDYAHSRGVLHRDLKPGNIMLGRHGETLVVDWGLAKPLGEIPTERQSGMNVAEATLTAGSLPENPLQPRSAGDGSVPTMDGSTLGTPQFMSPEQAQGRIDLLGPASDIFGLGATLYAILTGKTPYEGKSISDVLRKAREADYPAPRAIEKTVPRALDAICLKAMARDPADRYPTAKEFAEDLERYLADEPVTAKADTLVERLGRLTRRHRGAFLAGAAGLAVVAVGAVFGAFIINTARERVSQAKDDALAAKAEAEAAEATAKQRAAESEAVLDFLDKRIFAAARPAGIEGGLGKDVKLADALEVASPALETGFRDQPLSEARLRSVLGFTNQYLGKRDEARRQLERSVELYLKHLGPEHLDTLDTRQKLSLVLYELGRIDDALKIEEDVLRICREKFGESDSATIRAMSRLGIAYASRGRMKEGQALEERAMELQRTNPKLDPQVADEVQANMAAVDYLLGRFDEAIEIDEIVLKERMVKLGPNHPDTLAVRSDLALIYASAGRPNDALPHAEEVSRQCRDRFGDEHPYTLMADGNLASVLLALDRFDDALKLQEPIWRVSVGKLGASHPDTLLAKNNLAWTYYEADRYDEALPLQEDLLKTARAALGSDHPQTLTAMGNLALTYHELDRNDDALALQTELLRMQLEHFGAEHPDTATVKIQLGATYYALNRFDDALPLQEEALRWCRSQAKISDPQVLARTLSETGMTYYALTRYRDALPLEEEAWKVCRERLGPTDPLTLVVMQRLAYTYAELDRGKDALKLREDILKARRDKPGPDHPDTLEVLFETATSLTALDRIEEAATLLEEGVTKLLAADGPDDPKVQDAQLDLIYAYARLGKIQKLAKMYADVATLQEKKDDVDNAMLFKHAKILALIAREAKSGTENAKQKIVEKSLALLKQLIESGDYDADDLRKLQDTDFSAIRDRVEFKKLLGE